MAGTPHAMIAAASETTETGTGATVDETSAAWSASQTTGGAAPESATGRATGETFGPASATATAGSMDRAEPAVELEEGVVRKTQEAPAVRELTETAPAPATGTATVTETGGTQQPRMTGAGGSQPRTTAPVAAVPPTARTTEGTVAAMEAPTVV